MWARATSASASTFSAWKTPHGSANRDATGKLGGAGGGEFAKQVHNWPTPHHHDGLAGGRTAEQLAAHREATGAGARNLHEEAPLWQTPSAAQFDKRRQARQTEREELLLPAQAAEFTDQMWPSPRAEDSECIGNHPGAEDSLYAQASLWATPRAMTGGGESAERKQELGRLDAGGGDLQAQVETWPTPMGSDSNGGGTHRTHTKGGRDLTSGAQQWPTPTGRDAKGGYSPEAMTRKDGKSREDDLLPQAVENWPTPTAADGKRQTDTHVGGNPTLSGAAKAALEAWPTPSAQDAEASGSRNLEGSAAHRGVSLTDATETGTSSGSRSSLPDPKSSPDGRASSPATPPSRRRLSPRFDSWLMGWPLIGGIGSASSDKGWFHFRRRMRSALSGLVGR